MAMQQLIYASRPFGYDSSVLAGILSQARVKNKQNDITGALICRADIYLQLIEGPAEKIETVFDKISRDDRHLEVVVLVREQVEDRLFPEWEMKHDPANSWLWSPDEIHDGILQTVSADQVRAVFIRSSEAS
ncbi:MULTISPECIES: BLUF domain-containing protein [Roseobacter]|uniref:Blue light sensor protein n=1 Tax=Roseobacter litoralis (strain ATCC 49566 / DSM 6996 / JCM 21268 / NBRC 15278 / OCh 149) TaxID=391595 RepID=F7ZIV2_ROSLO|nr:MULTISPECIES: BLUF domain-containing protein [Roseobacter]AEI95012.1 putative blue light sensor protein [Roseobacter litoralis Och 149]GIT86808.1 hypothetical protein ROBYS_18240 [Roseobacter sp. OBYS 0001]